MSKKYIAKINNIFFKGKRYNVGDPVLVDDKETMNEHRWETEKDYIARIEKVAKDTGGLTEKESVAKIKDLTAKLEKATADKAEADAKIVELEKQVKDLTAKLEKSEGDQGK